MQHRQTTTVVFTATSHTTATFATTVPPRRLEQIIITSHGSLHITTRQRILPARAKSISYTKRDRARRVQIAQRMQQVAGAILSLRAGGGFGSYAIHFDVRLLPRHPFLNQAFAIVTHLCEQLAIDKRKLHPTITQTTEVRQGRIWIALGDQLAQCHGYFCPLLSLPSGYYPPATSLF